MEGHTKGLGVDPRGRVCLQSNCVHYLQPAGCAACVQSMCSNTCDVCYNVGPAYPIYHLGPAPFVPVRTGDCVHCKTVSVKLNTRDECADCVIRDSQLKDTYTKRGMISVLCDAHASLVIPYCVNGHKLMGHHVGGTLLCYGCFTSGPSQCKGCKITHNSRNKDLCPDCQTKVNGNICTLCSKDTYGEYVDQAGRCETCSRKTEK